MIDSYSGEGINTWNEIPTEIGQTCSELVGYTEVGNFEAAGFTSTEEVSSYLRETLPPSHLEGCPKIQYEPITDPSCPNALGYFRNDNHEIKILNTNQSKEQLLETLTHEVGHNAHANIMENRSDVAQRWSDIHQKSLEQYVKDGSGFVSDYARTNVYEDFAESYQSYVRDPEKLKFYNPDKFEFMRQELFAGREYVPPVLAYLDYDSLGRQIEVTGNGTWVVATGEKIA